jgi:hypothetical protein
MARLSPCRFKNDWAFKMYLMYFSCTLKVCSSLRFYHPFIMTPDTGTVSKPIPGTNPSGLLCLRIREVFARCWGWGGGWVRYWTFSYPKKSLRFWWSGLSGTFLPLSDKIHLLFLYIFIAVGTRCKRLIEYWAFRPQNKILLPGIDSVC